MTDDPQTTNDKKTDGAGLIHQTIPDVAETEPRPDFAGNCMCCTCQGKHCLMDHPGHSCGRRDGESTERVRDILHYTLKGHFAGYDHAKKQIRFLLFRNREWIHPERLNGLLAAIDALQSTDGLKPTEAEQVGSAPPSLSEASGSTGRSESAQDNSGWQSISTAPKDGTFVLVYAPQHQRAFACQWDAEFEIVGVSRKGDVTHRGAWTDRAVLSFGYEEVMEYDPSHWMPLPSPPTEEK